MATPTSSKNLTPDEFRKMVADHGRDTPVTEFLNGDVLQAACVISNELALDHREYGYAKEHAAKSAAGKVAAACPKMCANCGALEMRGEFRSDGMIAGVTVKASARCTSAGYCPNEMAAHAPSFADNFNREYTLSPFPRPHPAGSAFPDLREATIPLIPVELELQQAADTVLSRKSQPSVEPASTPKTKTDLIW